MSFTVSSVTFKSLVYFEFSLIYDGKKIIWSLYLQLYSLPLAVYWRARLLPHCSALPPSLWIDWQRERGFPLGSLSRPTDLCVWLWTMQHCLDYCSFLAQFEIRVHDASCFGFLSQDSGYFCLLIQILELFLLVPRKMPLVFWRGFRLLLLNWSLLLSPRNPTGPVISEEVLLKGSFEDGILCEAFPHSHFKFFSHRYHDLYFFDFYSLILSSGYELFEGKKPFFNSSQNPHFLLN